MKYEVKLFPHLKQYSSDGKSIIAMDIPSMTLFEVDDITALILETPGMDESFASIGEIQGIGMTRLQESQNFVKELIERGVVTDTTTLPERREKSLHITHILLDIAQDCQLACRYCYASGGDYGDKSLKAVMDFETGRKTIDFFFENCDPDAAVYTVTFFGGEPLMNWPLIERLVPYVNEIVHAKRKKVIFSITTNGLLLDEEKADFLALHKFSVVVSIDGSEKVHNELRPHRDSSVNSYQGTVRAINLLHERNLWLSGRATLTSKCSNPGEIEKSIRDIGVKKVNVQMVSCSTDDPLALTTSHMHDIVEYSCKRIFENEDDGYRNIHLRRLHNGIKSLRGCSFGENTLAVDSTGRIYACHRLISTEAYHIGSVSEGLFIDKALSLRDQTNVDYRPGCRACWARYICGGGCPADNYQTGGEVFSVNPHQCRLSLRKAEALIEYYLMNQQRQALYEAAVD